MSFETLEKTFALFLTATWQATLIAGIILITTFVLKEKLSPAWRCRLWLLVFARLILPTLPNIQTNLFLSPVARDRISAVTWPTQFHHIHLTTTSTTPQFTPTPQASMTFTHAAMIIYLLVAFTLITQFALTQLLFNRRIKRNSTPPSPRIKTLLQQSAAEISNKRIPQICITTSTVSPALFGFLFPRLLLPVSIESNTDTQLRYIFLHELAHQKRRDTFMLTILNLIRCIHWLNPVAWFAARCYRIEAESACDEIVLQHLSEADRLPYGQTLLHLATVQQRNLLTFSAKNTLKRRLHQITQAKRKTKMQSTLAVALLVILALLPLVTHAQQKPAASTNESLITQTYDWPPFNYPGMLDVPFPHEKPVSDEDIAKGVRQMLKENTPASIEQSITRIECHNRKLTVTAPRGTQEVISTLFADAHTQVRVELRYYECSPGVIDNLHLPAPMRSAAHLLVNSSAPIFITRDQANALARAARADKTIVNITAPRLTLFNRQKAQLLVETQQAYIKDAQPVAAQGVTKMETINDTITAIGIDVECTMKVDPTTNEILLDAKSTLTTLNSIDKIEKTTKTKDGQALSATLQSPDQSQFQSRSAVTAPSGQYTLTGNIPTTNSDRRLYILAKAEIMTK